MANDSMLFTLTRHYSAEPTAVFDAWTDANGLSGWWDPAETRLTAAELDVREGGEYRIQMVSEVGHVDRIINGEFTEIERPSRLVFTWNWSDAHGASLGRRTVVTVQIVPANGGSELTLTHEGFANEGNLDRHFAGWTAALDGFGKYIRERKTTGA